MVGDKKITLAHTDLLRRYVRDSPRKRRVLFRALVTAIKNGRRFYDQGDIPGARRASAEIWRRLGKTGRPGEIHPYLLKPGQNEGGKGDIGESELVLDDFKSAGLELEPGTLERGRRRRTGRGKSTFSGVKGRRTRTKLNVSTEGTPRRGSVNLTSAEVELLAKIKEQQSRGFPFRTIARNLGEPYRKVLALVHRAAPGVFSFPRFRVHRINYADYPGGPTGAEVCEQVDKKDLSFRAIGRMYGVPAYTIATIYYSMCPRPRFPKLSRAMLATAQLKTKRQGEHHGKRQTLISRINKLRDQDLSLLEIARRLRLPRSQVWRAFREAHPGEAVRYYRSRKDYAIDPRGPEIDRLRHAEHFVFSEIGATLQMSVDEARKIYHARNPGPIPRLPRRSVDYGNYPGIDGEAVVKARVRGETYERIAKRFGVSRATIQRIFNAKRPGVTRRRNVKCRVDDLNRPGVPVETVFDFLSSGRTVRQIADKLHSSQNIVRRVIKKGLAAGYRCRPAPR